MQAGTSEIENQCQNQLTFVNNYNENYFNQEFA